MKKNIQEEHKIKTPLLKESEGDDYDFQASMTLLKDFITETLMSEDKDQTFTKYLFFLIIRDNLYLELTVTNGLDRLYQVPLDQHFLNRHR